MSNGVGGSRTPWWLGYAFFGVLIFAPGLVMSVIDRGVESLEQYGERLPDSTDQSSSDEYTPPCDTQAVLDALGMSVPEYQAWRGLYVDGLIGPQTGEALCSEEGSP